MRSDIAILFSDVSSFTEMTERLGDRVAFQVMGRYREVVRTAAAEHGGYEVELRGDGCLLAFPEIEGALACAIEIQRELDKHRRADPDHGVGVRIGLHLGRPIADAGTLFGRDVILAARLSDVCRTHGILVSRSFRRTLREAHGVGRERSVRLKGFREAEPVSRVYWRARSRAPAPGPLEQAFVWLVECLPSFSREHARAIAP